MMSLVLLSGGMDSTVALAHTLGQGHQAVALSVDYGQRHLRELAAAGDVARHYGVSHLMLDLTSYGALTPGNALTDSGVVVPEGHYAAPSMAATVVPNRNAVFLMAAVGIAQAHGLETVVTAVHAGDHPIYADCRPEFIAAANLTAGVATENRVRIVAPFVNATKTDIAREGHQLHAPLHLTWSCYQGGDVHCGRCGTCTERREAFTEAGVPDPTIYDDKAA